MKNIRKVKRVIVYAQDLNKQLIIVLRQRKQQTMFKTLEWRELQSSSGQILNVMPLTLINAVKTVVVLLSVFEGGSVEYCLRNVLRCSR